MKKVKLTSLLASLLIIAVSTSACLDSVDDEEYESDESTYTDATSSPADTSIKDDTPISDETPGSTDSPAESTIFYLGENKIEPGEFVVISAKDIDDPSDITMWSEPSIDFTPTFFKVGEYAHALVPIPMEFEGTEVNFTCVYGDVVERMKLDITPKAFRSVDYDIDADVVNQTRTRATIDKFNRTAEHIAAVTEPVPLWDGLFIKGVDNAIVTGFGVLRTISATGETYSHQGVDYVATVGDSVMAINNGKVVYAGYLDLPGYMVVIDHGLGLKSWYCHLGEIRVKVGDTVTKGDVIGCAGITGFTENPFPHIGLSVFDVPVCPYDLWDQGITFAIFDSDYTVNSAPEDAMSYEEALTHENALLERLKTILEELNAKTNSKYVGRAMGWPLPHDYTRVASGYGVRFNPSTEKTETHNGIDIPAPYGTDIYASNAGRVIAVAYHECYGNYIVIDHGGGYASLYAHSARVLVKKGDLVGRGDVIAEVGNTGYFAYGNLLHFAMFEGCDLTDPMKFFE